MGRVERQAALRVGQSMHISAIGFLRLLFSDHQFPSSHPHPSFQSLSNLAGSLRSLCTCKSRCITSSLSKKYLTPKRLHSVQVCPASKRRIPRKDFGLTSLCRGLSEHQYYAIPYVLPPTMLIFSYKISRCFSNSTSVLTVSF